MHQEALREESRGGYVYDLDLESPTSVEHLPLPKMGGPTPLRGGYFMYGDSPQDSILLPSNPVLEDDEVSDDNESGQHSSSSSTVGVFSHGYFLHGALSFSAAPSKPVEYRFPPCVPKLKEVELGPLDKLIGVGGERGAKVYNVKAPDVTKMNIYGGHKGHTFGGAAYKRYPSNVSPDEMLFIETVYRHLGEDAEAGCSKQERLERMYGADHLVIPRGVAVDGHSEPVGVLMPLFNSSLKQYMERRSQAAERRQERRLFGSTEGGGPSPRNAARNSCSGEGECGNINEYEEESSFRTKQSYAPIDSIAVISAIIFQVVEGLALLSSALPHGSGSTGFTHNDLHLENVLLSFNGHVALCDFELVVSSPCTKTGVERRRLPPATRQSPSGMFTESSDMWALGLMVLNLLTGVDPFFSTSITNDFSNAPQLSPWDRASSVLDWKANIEAHTKQLVMAHDPSGQRWEEAQPLLDLCSKCLVNSKGSTATTASYLRKEKIFANFREAVVSPGSRNGTSAIDMVRKWIETCEA